MFILQLVASVIAVCIDRSIVFSEPIVVEVAITNPLKVALMLYNVTLLWQFMPACSLSDGKEQVWSNETDFCSVSTLSVHSVKYLNRYKLGCGCKQLSLSLLLPKFYPAL